MVHHEKNGMTIGHMSERPGGAIAPIKKRNGRVNTVIFGEVQIEGKAMTQKARQRNVQSGQFAFERVARQLSEPGVSIQFAKSVPVFFADEEDPGVLIRELNGKRSKGVFQKGRFKSLP